jgi:hypothetical protein
MDGTDVIIISKIELNWITCTIYVIPSSTFWGFVKFQKGKKQVPFFKGCRKSRPSSYVYAARPAGYLRPTSHPKTYKSREGYGN